MYDQSLERLIDAVIADGVITDQERKVVYKKAASLGIDRDEIEVYLEGRLAKVAQNKPKSNKEGNIKTCPACGADIGSFVTKCPECGHEFRNTEAVESMEKFVKQLSGINNTEKKCELIKHFPIPNSKEDLLEFLSVSVPNSLPALSPFAKGTARWIMTGFMVILICCIMYPISGHDIAGTFVFGGFFGLILALVLNVVGHKKPNVGDAWLKKTETALNKANLSCVGDSVFSQQIAFVSKKYHSAKKVQIISFSLAGIVTAIITYFTFCTDPTINDMYSLINEGKYQEAESVVEKINQYTIHDTDNYCLYVTECVKHMADQGQYDQAYKFIESKKPSLKKYFLLEKAVNKQLKEFRNIIKSYQYPNQDITELEIDNTDESDNLDSDNTNSDDIDF